MVTGPIVEDEVPRIKRSPWADNFFRPLLITIMIMCLNISLVNLARLFNPAWRGTYFLLGMFLTTVEAIYSYRILRHDRSRGISRLRYRLAEGVVLILGLKALSLAGQSPALVWAELQAIWQAPLNFINLEFYVLLVLALIAWAAATNTMADFEELHDPYTFRSDRLLPLDSLASRFFWGGIALVLISGVTQLVARAGWASLMDWQRPSLGGVIFNVLVYFTLGLALLSQAHLTTLLMRWRLQKINVAADLVKQWARYGLLFLGLVTLVVFMLPTGYTLDFLTSAGLVVQFLLDLLLFILQLLFLLLTLPLAWLLSLLGQTPEERFVGAPELPSLPELLPGAPPVSWFEAIRSLIFWLLAGAMTWYLLKTYLNDHPELLEGLRRFKPIALLLHLLGQLWRRLREWTQAGLDLIPRRITSTGPAGESARSIRWRWAGLAGLSPRERILYYYLNILQRAAPRGPARQGHQTPYEYEPELSQAAPEAQLAVTSLTEAFVRARYSQDTFSEAQAGLAKALWQQIRRALRRRAEGEDGKDGV